MPPDKPPVILELSGNEALVFFDWLGRFNARTDVEFADQAEQRVLWDLEAKLEPVLEEPFDDRYDELLAEARAAVRDAVD